MGEIWTEKLPSVALGLPDRTTDSKDTCQFLSEKPCLPVASQRGPPAAEVTHHYNHFETGMTIDSLIP